MINYDRKEKFNCVCGGKHTYNSKSQHLKTKKHLEYIKKNDEKSKQNNTNVKSKSHHLKTKKDFEYTKIYIIFN